MVMLGQELINVVEGSPDKVEFILAKKKKDESELTGILCVHIPESLTQNEFTATLDDALRIIL